MYKYLGFGLNIASDIAFPELLPNDFADADISITIGHAPLQLEGEGVVTRAFSSINASEYLLDIKNVCRYYVSQGSKIIAEPATGIDEHSIRLFLLGTAMAAALYQRGNIPLHASAIVHEGKLILFAGNSGAGKSTLLALLATRGYDIFTDDVCVLKHDTAGDSCMLGTASYPMMKLWDDTILQLNNRAFNKDFKVRPELPKFGQFFYDTFHKESLPVDKIFILSPKSSAGEITIKKLGGLQAFKQMEKQAFKFQLITHTELRTRHFSWLSQLVGQAPVYEAIRPVSGTNVQLLADAIEKLF